MPNGRSDLSEDAKDTISQHSQQTRTRRSSIYAVLNPLSPMDICSTCRTAMLTRTTTITKCLARDGWAILSHVGDIKPWRSLKCAFCRLILLSLRQNGVNKTGGNGFDIIAFSSKKSQDLGFWTLANFTLEDVVLFGVVPRSITALGSTTFKQRLELLASISKSGYIAPEMPAHTLDKFGFRVQMVRPSLDWPKIREWLACCSKFHGDHFDVDDTGHERSLGQLRMIDCESKPPRVVAFTRKCKYVALSYVWGSSVGSDPDAKMSEPLSHNLPAVVEDAIAVTCQLHFRYLWIDRYCILQNDENDKHTQLRNMDLIYRNAEVTIIAAAGEDPNYGLPGVRSKFRELLPYADINGRRYIPGLPVPIHAIRASKWMTRGWTYQEAVFSRRRLFFTDDQAYFECSRSSCCEALDTNVMVWKGNSMLPAIFPSIGQFTIEMHIEEYSKRKLTFESDTINAMYGIFQSYLSLPEPVYQLCGVPLVPFPNLRPRHKKQLESRNGRAATRTSCFVRGLSWMSEHPSTRRPGFPSWSWAGWNSAVMWPTREDIPRLKLSSVVIESTTGGVVDIEAMDPFDTLHLRACSYFLGIEASTFKYQFRFFASGPGVFRFPKNGYYMLLSVDDKRNPRSRHIRLGLFTPSAEVECSMLREFDCVEISTQTILIVQEGPNFVERIGVVNYLSNTNLDLTEFTTYGLEGWTPVNQLSKVLRKIQLG